MSNILLFFLFHFYPMPGVVVAPRIIESNIRRRVKVKGLTVVVEDMGKEILSRVDLFFPVLL